MGRGLILGGLALMLAWLLGFISFGDRLSEYMLILLALGAVMVVIGLLTRDR